MQHVVWNYNHAECNLGIEIDIMYTFVWIS